MFLSGPIGAGKTTLGCALAKRLSGTFVDGDDFSDPTRPWYCSILQTSRSIVDHADRAMGESGTVVVAYPLTCINWIYFKRTLAKRNAATLFVSLRASWDSIVDQRRGRLFSDEERARIAVMIAQGYGNQSFSDVVIDTDRGDLLTTLAILERKVRSSIAGPGNPAVDPPQPANNDSAA